MAPAVDGVLREFIRRKWAIGAAVEASEAAGFVTNIPRASTARAGTAARSSAGSKVRHAPTSRACPASARQRFTISGAAR